MKNLLLLAALSICTRELFAQNHVPNPSFEDSIPSNNIPNFFTCANWIRYGGSADHWRVFNGTVPQNIGYQEPASGNSYVGLMPHDLSGHFEYIKTEITPLQPGQLYEVSMSVSLSDPCVYATDNLGAFFYSKGFDSTTPPYGNSFLKNVKPQIYYADFNPIFKVVNEQIYWKRLRGYFVADSAYNNMIIGGFNSSSGSYNVVFLNYKPTQQHSPYYYIDSVVVMPVAGPATVATTTTINDLAIYPNPGNGKFSLKGNAQNDASVTITIINAIGQVVYSQNEKPLNGLLSKEINLEGRPSGAYMLKLTDNKGTVNATKLVIE